MFRCYAQLSITLSMVGATFRLTKTLASLAFVFVVIGSLGTYLNLSNPAWKNVGVEASVLKSTVKTFPTKHCDKEVRAICDKLSEGVMWFLGLDRI